MIDLDVLHAFILEAKAATYVGGGLPVKPCRENSHDLAFSCGPFRYLDSYFGGQDFIGEEVVYHHNDTVWGMNYYGSVLKPDVLTGAEAGAMIKTSLSKMYAQGRFLGGWQHTRDDLVYIDSSKGDLSHFTGYEWIEKDGVKVYELYYHGGLIK
ncbi:MAG: DUF5680 domain-containing protein [Brevefilum sp.]